jgi:hypothetical protein
MNIKFEISKELIGKFHSILQNQLGKTITGVNIKDWNNQYRFEFFDVKDDGTWHVELDKYGTSDGIFRLYCSSMFLDIDIYSVKDLTRFCKRIDKVIEMQIEHVNGR